MMRLRMLLTFAWLGLRHWLATWLRWLAYCIDRRNMTLGGCGCKATERPWPLPVMKHSKLCRLSRADVMGWYTARQYIEQIDQRKPGATAALRRYLRGESEPSRTLRIAAMEFMRVYNRPPRYLPSPWRAFTREVN